MSANFEIGDYEQPKATYPPMPIVFSPTESLLPYLPNFSKPVAAFTPMELAAKREYVRRRLENGADYSDHSEMFSFDGTLGEMAKALGMKL